MKIAIISDIHGNSYALDAVLTQARREKAEKLLVLGDLFGYYYHPDRVWKSIQQWDYELIQGNHERLLNQIISGALLEEETRTKYGSGHRFAIEKLTGSEIRTICSAPESLATIIDGTAFLMCHGAPWDMDAYLYPDAAPEILDRAQVEGTHFVLIGHSHYSFAHRGQHSILLNAGSVGQARDRGGVATWAMVDTRNRVFQLKSTPYSTAALIKEVESIDPDVPYLKSILLRNSGENFI